MSTLSSIHDMQAKDKAERLMRHISELRVVVIGALLAAGATRLVNLEVLSNPLVSLAVCLAVGGIVLFGVKRLHLL